MSGQYDFTIERNTTFTKTVVWKDGNGVVVNLANYTAQLQIRQAPGATDPVLDLTTASGKLVIDGAAGSVTINITAAETMGLTGRRYYYDLRMYNTVAQVATRLLQGVITVSPEVTR